MSETYRKSLKVLVVCFMLATASALLVIYGIIPELVEIYNTFLLEKLQSIIAGSLVAISFEIISSESLLIKHTPQTVVNVLYPSMGKSLFKKLSNFFQMLGNCAFIMVLMGIYYSIL